jgi:hypothetical protein
LLKAGSREAFRVYDEHAFMSGVAVDPAEPLGLIRSHPPAVLSAADAAGSAGRRPGGRAIRAAAAVLALGAGAATVVMALVAQRLGPSDAPVAHVLTRRASRSMGPRNGARVGSFASASKLPGIRRAARWRSSRAGARARRTGWARQQLAGGVVDRAAVAAKVASAARAPAVVAATSSPVTAAVSAAGGGPSRGEFGFER